MNTFSRIFLSVYIFVIVVMAGIRVHAQVPTVQDCLGAIPVCQDIYVEPNVYTGSGNYPNEINPNQTCPNSCMDGETNTVWYVFTVQQSGVLRLSIDPEDPNEDYDWAVYDLTTMRCDQIYGSAAQMQGSCNAAGGSGYHGVTGVSSLMGGNQHCENGGNTNKWCMDQNVVEGETWVLCVSNWTPSGNDGFTLDFTASTAIIYDNVRPELSSVNSDDISCGQDYLVINFSENVTCESVHPEDFVLSGPGGPYNIVDVVGEACELGGNMEKQYTIYFDPPIESDGSYSLELTSLAWVWDACGNISLGNTIVFNVDLGAPEIDFSTATIGTATCGLDNGSITGITVNGTPPYNYEWTNSDGIVVGYELDLIDVPGDDYTLEVQDENTCSTLGGPYTVPLTGAPDVSDDNMVIVSANFGANNGSITGIEVDATEPIEYLWTDNAANPVGTDLDLISVYTGNYLLRVTDANTCDTVVGPYLVPQIGGPLGVNAIATPEYICEGTSSQLMAQSTGGTGNYTYSWTSDPAGFTSDIQDPLVYPLGTTTYFIAINDGYNTENSSITVVVHELPLADAGEDQNIPYGTSTTIYASASGGSGAYNWIWEPTDKLINPTAQNPATHNLYEPTVFTLYVEDIGTNCVSETSSVLINLDGGPLGVTVEASSTDICDGETSHLIAIGAGGNFPNYTYEWSNGIQVISTQSEVTIEPFISTTYTVTVNDGFNLISDQVTITVHPSPDFTFAGGNGINACPYDTIILKPENPQPGWNYYWSNGSVSDELRVGSSGAGYDIKQYSLTIENEFGCNFTNEVTVFFDYSFCFGVGESNGASEIHIYPNPTTGLVNIEIDDVDSYLDLRIFNMEGKEVYFNNLSNTAAKSFKDQIDMNSYSKGVFILKIVHDDFIHIGKLILE